MTFPESLHIYYTTEKSQKMAKKVRIGLKKSEQGYLWLLVANVYQ